MALDIYTGLDVNRVAAFPLSNDGTFNVAAIEDLCGGGIQDLYEGIEFEGPTGFEVNYGTPRSLPVVAQGQVQATFLLPSIEAKTGILRCAYDKLTLSAMLSGVAVDTVGEGKFMPQDTDKSGKEPLVGLLLQQLQAKDGDGQLVWHNNVIHRATVVPDPVSYTAEVMVKTYNIAMSRSSKRLWGETYTLATHKCLKSSMDDGISSYQFNMGVWVGNGEYTSFNLPTGKPAKTSAKAKVWDFSTGAARAGAWDDTTDAMTFTPSVLVADGTVLVVTYEMTEE
jgi:hypothetical protein